MSDFYELLNVAANASFEEIKCNYKQLILQCHPDKLHQLDDPNLTGESTQNGDFNAINVAWNTLKDPIKRKHYDAELLQLKFQTHSNIYAHVQLEEMQRIQVEIEDEDDGDPELKSTDKGQPATMWSYAYDCRCGGQYLYEGPGPKDTDESPATSTSPAQSSSSEVIVECNECSLVIIVKQTGMEK
ncbi:DPH4 homolog [Drosophila bipectinata]|uniref:DPH4 homolog n=1 Tax=Drosophila bipectinata TaxID=42026 RepID=UPI001C8932A9|nr:DPH4 homolog [Drosophila bipectinata]XP_017110269.2 DPH4 homolog [Drosophila bipectinata]